MSKQDIQYKPLYPHKTIKIMEAPYTCFAKYLLPLASADGRRLTLETRDVRPGVQLDVQPGVRPDVRPDVRAAPVSSAAPKKNHLIEAAPFGRLDQM